MQNPRDRLTVLYCHFEFVDRITGLSVALSEDHLPSQILKVQQVGPIADALSRIVKRLRDRSALGRYAAGGQLMELLSEVYLQDAVHSLRVTFTYVFVSVPLQLAVALLIALVLEKGLRGLPFYRSVFYLPSLLGGSVAVAILWKQMFSLKAGVTGQANAIRPMPVSSGVFTKNVGHGCAADDGGPTGGHRCEVRPRFPMFACDVECPMQDLEAKLVLGVISLVARLERCIWSSRGI